LTKAPLPAVDPANWTGKFSAKVVDANHWLSTSHGENAEISYRVFDTELHKNGDRYYEEWAPEYQRNLWDIEYDFINGKLEHFEVINPEGRRSYNADGSWDDGWYEVFEGNIVKEYYDGELRAYSERDGNTVRYYGQGDETAEFALGSSRVYDPETELVTYYYADGAEWAVKGKESFEAQDDYLIYESDPDGKNDIYYIFQLSGKRLLKLDVSSNSSELSILTPEDYVPPAPPIDSETPTAPVITAQLVAPDEHLWVNSPVTLSIAATGEGLSYQWYFKGKKIAKATNATYTIPKAAAKNSGEYYVEVKNANGTVHSEHVTLTINATAKPKITVKPEAKVATTLGGSFTLSVGIADNITPGLTYQWFKDGQALNGNGADTATYSVAAATTADIGKYTVEISNVAGKVKSSAAVVSAVLAPTNAVNVETAAANEQVALLAKGVKLTAKLAKASAKPIGYQWVRVNAADGTEEILADKAAKTATYTAKADGLYKVRLLLDKADSTKYIETIIGQVKIIVPPVAKALVLTADKTTAAAGEAVKLTLASTQSFSEEGLVYTWFANGKKIETTSVPELNTVQTDKATSFTVEVTNGYPEKKIVGKAKSKAVKVQLTKN
jgi:hypothetical protein